jgi:putative MATE family efflux protein
MLRLALPALASYLLRIGYQWVDALWVRGLGVEATAAVTTSIFVVWTMYAINDTIAIGVTAFTSQLLGAGERRRAGLAAWKGLRASAALGLIGTAAGIFGARAIYGLMGSDAHQTATGAAYLAVVLGGAPIPMVALTCESIMRAAGDTRTPLFLDLCAVGLNAALDPLLIYGAGPIHGMGVAGAAWATLAAQTLLVVGYLLMAARGHRAFPLARRAEGPPVRLAGMVRVGIPAALIGMLFSVVYIAFAHSASRFGAASLATVGIANRIEAIQFACSIALGTAGAALVGQNLGAGRPDRAVQAIRTGLTWNFWVTSVITVALLAIPGAFLTLFTRDPAVHALGVPYLRILALCLVFNGFEIVTAESVMGSGHTVVLSWIFSSFSIVRIPLAFLAPRWVHPGVLGIAWVITLTCVVRALLIVGWAARGTWKQGLRRELRSVPPDTSPAAAGGPAPQ